MSCDGTKSSARHFLLEAAIRRSQRRLSQIAKGPLDPLFKNERTRG
jgi:hypothetical protein